MSTITEFQQATIMNALGHKTSSCPLNFCLPAAFHLLPPLCYSLCIQDSFRNTRLDAVTGSMIFWFDQCTIFRLCVVYIAIGLYSELMEIIRNLAAKHTMSGWNNHIKKKED